jgi:hypothetical protein
LALFSRVWGWRHDLPDEPAGIAAFNRLLTETGAR